jgi:hypothetical protein
MLARLRQAFDLLVLKVLSLRKTEINSFAATFRRHAKALVEHPDRSQHVLQNLLKRLKEA